MTPQNKHINRKTSFFFIVDTFIVVLAFTLVAWYKPATKHWVIPHYDLPFFLFLILWITGSFIAGKYNFKGQTLLRNKLRAIFIANTIVLAAGLSLLALLDIRDYSRLLTFGTFGLSTIFELIAILPIISFEKASRTYYPEHTLRERKKIKADYETSKEIQHRFSSSVKEGIKDLAGEDVYKFIKRHIPTQEENIYFTATRRAFNIQQKQGHHTAVINLQSINAVPNINKLFKATNEVLPDNGLYFSFAETIVARKQKILKRTFPPFNYIHYCCDYLIHRAFSKMHPFRLIYNWHYHSNRAISKAELLGRLYAAGFAVVDEDYVNDKFVFIAQKVKAPLDLDYETIGGLIKLKRLGKNGKVIGVYKFRTMHPYSEFIQEYIYNKNNLSEGGKFKDDFRINTLGKYLRKMWLDELPMFINILKGEMKIVGVRPLSQHYFSLYTKELQDLRITTKPGLLPPFYADTPVTLDEIMESELRYLNAYKAHPIRTDINYFFKILYNILIKKRRSQ